MYENIGEKIKVLAQVLGWIYLIAGVIGMLIQFINGDEPALGLVFLLGGIVMYISTWFLYGFGQLIEDVSAIRNKPTQTVEAPVVVDELPEL